ncbi:MAG: hypothetical protein ACXACI_01935 [Candidatus Hodarchaeales archaeon]|jgi:hypothetical protein
MTTSDISYITKIRKDMALRVPDHVWNLGYTADKVVEVTLRVLSSLEESQQKKEASDGLERDVTHQQAHPTNNHVPAKSMEGK